MDNPERLAKLGTQDTTQKTKNISNTDPTKYRGWTQVLVKGN